jgi:hypothetical protein
MKNPVKNSILLLAFLCFGLHPMQAQWSIGISIGGLAFHQKKPADPNIYPCKLDKKGIGVFIAGINLSLSYRINDYFGVKAVQSLIFYDSGGKFAGISHLGLQLHDDIVGMNWKDHHTSMSIGPFWYYRKNWTQIPGYHNDPDFIRLNSSGVWERKFVWYGGFMDYRYVLNERMDFTLDVLPGYPHIYALGLGMNRKINL